MLDLEECPSKDQEDIKELTDKDQSRPSSNSLQSNKKVNQKHGVKKTKIDDNSSSTSTQI